VRPPTLPTYGMSNTHGWRRSRLVGAKEDLDMKTRRRILLVIALLAALPALANAQALADSASSSDIDATVTAAQPDLTYTRPKEATKFHNYVFDAFGPYPIVGAALVGGVNQAYNSPPEWKQGAVGYSKRFGSNLGIAAISTTTRYGLAQALKEDTLYYRCGCKGMLPRLRYAVTSTLTARRGEDGHRVFSLPALVAPYAGTMTAVYAWYPDRYNGKDAFRMGNYVMLGYVGANVGLEFFYSGPHSLLSRMHLNNAHGAPGPVPGSGSNP
jgi:hypothetical protein